MAPAPSRSSSETAKSIALWVIPPLVSLVLFWPGLISWFQRDDFAWLGLRDLIHSLSDLGTALFHPYAQGTVRTLSERIYFLTFYSLFGLHALPYRILGFLTHFANLTMIAIVTRKISGSRAAGFWAALFWGVNSVMSVPLAWTSIYYELLLSLNLLLCLWLLMRYDETGARRFLVWQWVAFTLGFFVLELNVVYPGIALVYALSKSRRLVWKVVPMFALSAVYTVWHMAIAPMATGGPYKMYFDKDILKTFLAYGAMALGPHRLEVFDIHHGRTALTIPIILGLGVFLAVKLWKREWIVLLFPAWYLAVLSPLLPLRDHISDYYLTIPIIGLCMWGGWAVVDGWKAGIAGKALAVIAAGIYLGVSIPVANNSVKWFHDVSMRLKAEILGIAELHRPQASKTILIKNADPELFRAGLYHKPLRLFGFGPMFLVPEDEARLNDAQYFDDEHGFYIDLPKARMLLARNEAAVYEYSGERVRDITAEYKNSAENYWQKANVYSNKIDVGDDASADRLGPEWYRKEGNYRWSPKRASLRLNGPRNAGEKLTVNGYLPPDALKDGPVTFQIKVDGLELARQKVDKSTPQFSFACDLPAALVGRPEVTIEIAVDRAYHPPHEARELGAVFGTFEIH
jgi:hypothetical protein